MHLGPHHHSEHCHGQHAGEDGDARGPQWNLKFAVAVVLNILLVIGEVIGGLLSGSMALLADAGHNLGDVAGLLLAWGAIWLRGRKHTGRWTYGWRSFTVLAAQLNGLLLVIAIVGVTFESARRLANPTEIQETPVLIVALLAALLNFGTAKLLHSDGRDLNLRGAYLHMLADAAVSMAVVLGALAIMWTGWHWLDPAISLAICVVLSFGTYSLLRESTAMLMHAAPAGLDLADLEQYLLASPGVVAVADLHVWSVSTTDAVLSARIGCPELTAAERDGLVEELRAGLLQEFGVAHSTIEIFGSSEAGANCSLER